MWLNTFNEERSTISVKTVRMLELEVSQDHIRSGPERLQPLKELPPSQNLKAQERLVGM